MYRPEVMKARIKHLCSEKNISVEKMLEDCGLGVNAVRQIGGKRGMSAKNLTIISEYLECTVEYLLGISFAESPDEVEIDRFVYEYMTRPIFAETVRKMTIVSDNRLKMLLDTLRTICPDNI